MTIFKVLIPKGTTSVTLTGLPVTPVKPVSKGSKATSTSSKGKSQAKNASTTSGSYVPIWLLIALAALVLLLVFFVAVDVRYAANSRATVGQLNAQIATLNTQVADYDQIAKTANARADAAEAQIAKDVQALKDVQAKVLQTPATSADTQAPAAANAQTDQKAEDIVVSHFSDLGKFIIDGDQQVVGWKTQGAQMTYICTKSYGVFVTMDPGVVQNQSTGDLGAVAYVSCSVGDTIKIQTPHWSTSALHNQTHLVELTDALSNEKLIEALKVLKVDEGKQLAFYIDKDKVTKY